MGLQIGHDRDLGEVVEHSGGLPGYGSNMRWVKNTRVGLIALGNATYVPMRFATRRALAALTTAGLVHRPKPVGSPQIVEVGTALFNLLVDWDEKRAGSLFADNVAPDESLAARQRAAAALVSRHGTLKLARIDAEDRSSGRIVAHAATGEVVIPFQIAPVGGVQKYDLPA
jgi:hypothetical protein